MKLENLTALEIVDGIKSSKFTCVELVEYYLNQIEKFKDKNAVLEVFDDALEHARIIDKKVADKEDLPALVGVPILIKDNIMYKGKICSNASKIMENSKAKYNASVIQKLLDAGCVILGRTNMDEFAMGGSCENSAFGPCKNAHDDTRVSGGSSGGSAVAVACDMCAFALGSDTGGSVRQPSSFNGVVGIKPTYGRVSRYGLVEFAGSLDTVGVISKDVKDSAYVLSIIAGQDEKDNTSSASLVDDYLQEIKDQIKGKKIAVVKEVWGLVAKTDYASVYQKVLNFCQEHGAIVTETSLPEYEAVLAVYYTLAMAEASSNMARFDGIRYGQNGIKIDGIKDEYERSKSAYLGREVKRRIMLGNFILSSERYNSYYIKAKQIQNYLRSRIKNILSENDLIFMPTTYGEAFEIGSKTSDPVSMYIEDIFTVTANIVSVPALSVPIGKGNSNLPIGLQILAREFNEKEIYNMADFIYTHYTLGGGLCK